MTCCCCVGPCGSCPSHGTCYGVKWTTDVVSNISSGPPSNPACASCASYNGTWTLLPNRNPSYTLTPAQQDHCVWDSGDTDPCGGNYPSWIVYTDGTNWWLLRGGGNQSSPGAYANSATVGSCWKLAVGSPDFFRCDLGNTMFPTTGPLGQCNNHGVGIVITPTTYP